jgi:DNA-binding transcriptional LysR family regulator
LPLRSAVHFLPEIMIQFREEFPDVALNVSYVYGKERIDVLLQGDQDLVFGLESTFAHLPGVALHRIFTSRIYLVVRKDDPLASREEAVPADLRGRTLLVGGNSPPVLRKAQSLVVNSVHPSTLNSPDHMSTLTSIAAGLGVCLVPGFCNDHSGEFSWVPFSGGETFSCVWAVKKDDKRDITRRFIEMTREVYERHCACAD